MQNEIEVVQNQNWLINFWNNGDFLSHGVLIILLVMSILSWMQIILKLSHFVNRNKARAVVKEFWHTNTIDQALALLTRKLGAAHIYTNLAKNSISAANSFDSKDHKGINKNFDRPEFISSVIRQRINESATRLESGMTILASIGSVAPFVGLFGTVYGIHKALVNISINGTPSLGVISGPIGESLIMTAFGLFVAIPAVLSYNSFIRSNSLEMIEINAFANDLQSYLNVGTISPASDSE